VGLIQRNWYTKNFEPERVLLFIKWLERRMSILITFPFDVETFNLDKYRQKNGGDYMGNLALVYDCFAMFSSFYKDATIYETLSPHLEPVKEPISEEKASDFLEKLMNNVQGDSLCIQYQKQFIESRVRIGDRLIFNRRRTEVVGPTHMEVITECNGVERAKIVHKNADVRLLDVYKLPENHNMIWMTVIDYYVNQKQSFPWLKQCLINHMSFSGDYEDLKGRIYPSVIHIPIINHFGVWCSETKCLVTTSLLQAILRWMQVMLKDHDGTYKYNGKNYFLKEILEEFV